MPQSSYATRHKAKASPRPKNDLRGRDNFQSVKALKKQEAKEEERMQNIRLLNKLSKIVPF